LASSSPEVQAEIARRHKSAATTVIGLVVATILVSVVAYLARPYFIQKPNPPLDIAVRIAILIIGLGAIMWRRTKFAPMRLQDIVGVAGPVALVQTLEKVTIQIALFAATITAIGFISTLVTGNDWYTYWSSAIAVIILLYGYPVKSAWMTTIQRFTQPQAEPVTETPPPA
jgi:hypothetical protein